ncbi:hypothetical protein BED35_21970 [Yersinia enterocolitica]|uniref:hypothetical protein n=1 Tax=Yersinia TaxID=629 RepID=UPI0005E58F72|nr:MULTISPECIES: hypothetical protein [Yersinia]CNL44205.1 Uncharacterised protein [Yersinia frederiksenii]AOF13173.1 hypothetical protein BB936_00450 [Yersinia enterocolitica]AOF20796.1 hypothetical protein BED34_21505 [Yersinia enterocolitica]AOF21762.1 hypothetical protein BED33_02650 [Yersinia enterocolitica]AOF28971.1 hypothetical protein BED32_21110 [Yersinia enterocolitica]
MLSHNVIEMTLINAAKLQGVDLDNKDLLDIRTKVAATLAAKERHRQRISAPAYQWTKPAPRR